MAGQYRRRVLHQLTWIHRPLSWIPRQLTRILRPLSWIDRQLTRIHRPPSLPLYSTFHLDLHLVAQQRTNTDKRSEDHFLTNTKEGLDVSRSDDLHNCSTTDVSACEKDGVYKLFF